MHLFINAATRFREPTGTEMHCWRAELSVRETSVRLEDPPSPLPYPLLLTLIDGLKVAKSRYCFD